MPAPGRILTVTFLLAVLAAPTAAAPAPDAEHFEKKVRPLLAARCWQCHGPEKTRGGLRLDSAAGLQKGGDSGPAVVAGKPDESRLIQAVRQTGDLKMPPKERLTEQEIADLVRWVTAGAVWPAGATSPPASVGFTPEQKAFWAFQPVKASSPPAVRTANWPTSPIDRFILARMEEKGLAPAPPADKRSLLRRVTFDLTGLPPTPEEVDAFVKDESPAAFEKVVDRLLASPHYGERWGRHWLDVVRYADSTANDANAVMRFAFRYRDYVIGAFNKDKPYDRFIVEQLAGDLLEVKTVAEKAEVAERVIATGFLMVGPKALAETDKEQSRLDIVDDQIDVTGRAFLGLTLACARCHDHKFDPIPTRDYYALAGIFRSTEVFQDENRNATMWQEWPLFAQPDGKPFLVMAPKEGKAAELRVHLRGSRFNLGAVAPRRFPQILAGDNQPPLPSDQSGRLQLARWIASPANPLTARVMVNRIWQGHFGAGLVATGDNFGMHGEKPSHPELLDWLADRFVASGWSVKAMHRLMLLSSTYQMAGTPDERSLQIDPNDRLFWRMPRRRLEAEEVRDALLAVSGRLERKVGGGELMDVVVKTAESLDPKRGFYVPRVKSDHECYHSDRRSVYLPVIRNALPEVLALFDAADPNGVTTARNDTTVPSQALYLLNNPFVREQALHLAKALLAETGMSDQDRLRSAYGRVLGRPPSAEDVAEGLEFLRAYVERARAAGRSEADRRLTAWRSYCQMLFCANEFLYVD
jgi:mono/diheme cytochrome c family protein